MKILKPNWVTHDDNAIFSIDIHPDGSRFATGGQGDNSGRVAIWNMSPLTRKEDEYNENVPKQLCRLDNHLSCVNCVRWSNSGKWLASAGDDKVIMIWQFAGRGGIAFGGVSNAESWRCCNSLQGHSNDILDLNWSPNDNYLASCSVDNTIRIWNAENFPECIKILSGHQGIVKGVSWDPMGKYLSSQSDDKSLKIWRTSDWKEEVSISKPFVDCGGTTHVLRLNWCPDGQFLVSAHAMNNLGSTAQIVTREEWNTEKDFVGHRKAVTCVRFNPKFLYKVSKKDKKNKFFCVAIGSRDQSLSVWLINRQRPLFVMHELFKDSILDISWSQDGYKMLCCSSDGSVAYFEFNEEELGKVLDGDEVSTYLHKLYGKNMISMQKKANQTMFIEDIEMLKVRESNEMNRRVLAQQNGGLHNNSMSNNRHLSENTNSNTSRLSKGSTEKQIETRTIDGKRRITPLFIPPQTNCDGMPIPFKVNENQQPTFSTSKEVASRIQIEKIDSLQSSASLLSQPSPDKRNNEREPTTPTTSINKSLNVNNRPQQDSSGDEVVSKKTSTQSASKSSQQQKEKSTTKSSSNNNTIVSNDKQQLSKASGRKIDLTTITPAPISRQIPTLSTQATTPTVQGNDKRITDKQIKDNYKSSSLFSDLHAPKIDKVFSSCLNSEKFKDCTLVVDNNLSNSNLCSLRLVDQEHNQLWQVLVSQKISTVVHSDEMVCISCEDNTIHVFNLQTGNRLKTPFLVSSSISKLACFKYKLLVITVKAELWLWNLEIQKVIVKNVSLVPLLHNNFNQSEISITNYCITSNGLPLITLSTGKTYVYDLDMETWHLLSNNQDLLNYSCDYKQKIVNGSEIAEYPLSLIQSQQRFLRQIHNVFVTNRSLQSKATLSYIDQQLASSIQLSSSKEYRYWLIVLAQFLANEGLEERFRELCEYLLGPIFASSSSEWSSTILGIDKRELLKEVLVIATSNLKLQRIYTEFKEQLDQVSESQMQIELSSC